MKVEIPSCYARLVVLMGGGAAGLFRFIFVFALFSDESYTFIITENTKKLEG